MSAKFGIGSDASDHHNDHQKTNQDSSTYNNVISVLVVLIIPWSLVRVQVGPPNTEGAVCIGAEIEALHE